MVADRWFAARTVYSLARGPELDIGRNRSLPEQGVMSRDTVI
jgi:hypothetical protein